MRHSRFILTLQALQAAGVPLCKSEIAAVTSLPVSTVEKHLYSGGASGQLHLAHTKNGKNGGTPAKYFAPGPAPEGYLPPHIGETEEEQKIRMVRRREQLRVASRASKQKKRDAVREAWLAANPDIAKLPAEEQQWHDPKFVYRPSPYAESFTALYGAFYRSEENHG